jgi:hypothetical protein
MGISAVIALLLVIVVLLIRVQKGFATVLDEVAANRIIEVGRIKTAEARVELYEDEQRHMCITPACRNPVIGRWMFAHCQYHLEPYERRWAEEKVEEGGSKGASQNDKEHPIAQKLRELDEEGTKELAQQNASKKIEALAEARELLNKASSQQRERHSYLPVHLLRKIEEEYERMESAVTMRVKKEPAPIMEKVKKTFD